MAYTTAALSFDGATLRTFGRDSEGGLVKPQDGSFTVWRNPLRLIGIVEPRRNRDAILGGTLGGLLGLTPAGARA